ncbi:hypothetical protein BB28_14900 [Mycobacteroides chelonae CCUG 47445]|nr:hypothetical protein BB28_14900 [Mycobacteroides chelonae CCUG 47445]
MHPLTAQGTQTRRAADLPGNLPRPRSPRHLRAAGPGRTRGLRLRLGYRKPVARHRGVHPYRALGSRLRTFP